MPARSRPFLRPRPRPRTGGPAADRVLPDELEVALGEALEPVAPPPEVAARLRRRLMSRVREDVSAAPVLPDGWEAPAANAGPDARTFVVRADRSGWGTVLPGVRAKLLCSDGRSETLLLDCDAGAVIGAHRHHGVEELTVLKGRLECEDGSTLGVGDFQLSLAGSRHGRLRACVPTLLQLRLDHAFSRYFAA